MRVFTLHTVAMTLLRPNWLEGYWSGSVHLIARLQFRVSSTSASPVSPHHCSGRIRLPVYGVAPPRSSQRVVGAPLRRLRRRPHRRRLRCGGY